MYVCISTEKMRKRARDLRDLRGRATYFTAVLQYFHCLCRLLLPLSTFYCSVTILLLPLSTFTAFINFSCLCRCLLLCCLAAWPAPLPLSTFTAFLGMGDLVDFYCLRRLLLPLSTFTAFVGLHCLCLIFLSLSAITAFINFYCLCQLALPVSDFAVVVDYADFAYWMSQPAYLINYSALLLDLRIPTNSVPV